MYKFSRDVIFVYDRSPGFSWFYFRGSSLQLHMHCEDLIFVDDTSYPRKQQKLHPSKICTYTVCMFVCLSVHVYMCHVYICTYVCQYICTCVFVLLCLPVCTYIVEFVFL